MKWKETVFDNVARLNRGFDLPNQKIEDGPYPVVASTSIKALHKTFKVEGPGVVTGRSGSLGKVQYLPGRFWPLNTSLYVKDFKGNDERFVAYFLQTMRLENFNSGAGVPTLNQNHLHKLSVKIPTPPIQRKIAAILTGYDDLIETNKRRIALLEKMAEELYREWFVRMRFPGHQKTKFVKGVPEGWVPMPSSGMFDVRSGGTPKTNVPHFWDGAIPFFTPKDAPEHVYVGNTEKWITEKGLTSCNSPLYPKHTIFITARGTVGKIALAQCDMAMNQSCYALVPRFDQEVYFFYLAILNAIAIVKGVSKSGVFSNIIVDTFRIIPIYFPGEALIKEFNDVAGPILTQLESLLSANTTLTQTRDLLLPRLISGKLSVADLDIQFPPSMQEAGLEQVQANA